ncbi:MAG: hypothetical protein CMI02_00545 [Oceanospirillaceae bacterium]|nr:hypothetical protein [Oceanospirillaceae bacterium]MBT10507.1 hypothetical protein [Oceanospirillaceae bacterium]|tara:strand:+ start:352 stop:678 length:327 start_codon:yes stop_codon:yes gene_type:complete
MKPLLFCLLAIHIPWLYADETLNNLTVISVYQIDDESSAAFDFFTSERVHKCGGMASNRFRSYSRFDHVAERRFRLVTDALAYHYRLSISLEGCEGKAMKVGFIGVRR